MTISGAMINTQYIEEKELVSRAVKKKIFLSVLIAHVVLIVLPLLVYLISQLFKPEKPKTIVVRMVEWPMTDQQASKNVSKSLPEKVSPAKKIPPKAETKPIPRKPAKPKSEKAADKPKPQKPVSKPAPTKTIQKPKPEKAVSKPKSTWKAVKPEEIITSDKVVAFNNTPKPIEIPAFDQKAFLDKLRRGVKITNGRVPRGTTRVASANAISNYYDSVSSLLYRLWNQPSKTELGGRYPQVTVHVSIDGNGKIKASRISRKSGIAAMDASVNQLLKDLSSLPSPPGGAMDFDITLVIAD